jgi:Protein of unknown function (DUF3987)
MADGTGFTMSDGPVWGEPDMTMMRLNRRQPPPLPLEEIFGIQWGCWLLETAAAAGCCPDYVAMPLLATASALIGNARCAQATPGWSEPPHIWTCVVGDSGDGKSPGADCILRDVLPELERRMIGDFPDRLREWKADTERIKTLDEDWKDKVRAAHKKSETAPPPPADVSPPEPQAPRLRQNDVTVEKVATLLACAAPKGLLIVRDEMAGWLGGMNQYHDAGRSFWIEAYGGRPYRVERQKNPMPIDVTRLVVAAYGGTQPEKLATMLQDADDGLFSRVMWAWPSPVPFRLGREKPGADWAIEALNRLRELELEAPFVAEGMPRPLMVKMAPEALPLMEAFARDMQAAQQEAGGLMRSAFGKARGLTLRLSLVLEMLWWTAQGGMTFPPIILSVKAFLAAAALVAEYFMPMAERVYGDAAATETERNAATLARWIIKTKATEVHVRFLQREARLPGLREAEVIGEAIEALQEADWLGEQESGKPKGKRARNAYPVNPRVHAGEAPDGSMG